MKQAPLPPPPYSPAPESSRRYIAHPAVSSLAASEYVAAALTFIAGLVLGVLLTI
jgi:hypothetical protein